MRTLPLYFILSNFIKVNCLNMNKLLEERDSLLDTEIRTMLGHDIILNDKEQKANYIIMDLKRKEIGHGMQHPQDFILLKHFFDYKDVVKDSDLFKYIQLMPKGAILHAHDTGLLSPDYVMNITYMPHLYVCISSGVPEFRFSKTIPDIPCRTEWQLMEEVRFLSDDVKKFDEELRRHFTLVVKDPNEMYPDINAVWTKFQNYFITTSGLFTYQPVWEQYFYDALKAFREDNVMYVEIRSVLPELYNIEGRTFNSLHTAKVYKEVSDRFCADYPDFFGAKLIYAPMRLVNLETVTNYIKIAKQIKETIPDFLVGFDLVGQEDLGHPLLDFFPLLSEASSELDYFFHAGETNWFGSSSDENLADAILLGAKRIGHGFALVKHPVLLDEVQKRGIAIETNPISNAVLKLVADMRNHPAASLMAQNAPIVISSDDPGVWEAYPLSHDFYVTFMVVASQKADLKLLKKLAYNSLHYSAYPDKHKLFVEFDCRWATFIETLVNDR